MCSPPSHLERWGAEIEVHHILPQLPAASVITLACNAGVLIGVGGYRQEKGRGGFGTFRVITPEQPDAEWDELVAGHGRDTQLAALADPECADKETADLMAFYRSEVRRRAA